MRHVFPAKAPPEYWSAEYYNVMVEVVEQSAGQPQMSTAEDELENLLAKLPVQPGDGCVDPTEIQRRRECIKLLKQDDLPQVSELLHQKWKDQHTWEPTWMCHLIPK